jgi:hypothetical protein
LCTETAIITGDDDDDTTDQQKGDEFEEVKDYDKQDDSREMTFSAEYCWHRCSETKIHVVPPWAILEMMALSYPPDLLRPPRRTKMSPPRRWPLRPPAFLSLFRVRIVQLDWIMSLAFHEINAINMH